MAEGTENIYQNEGPTYTAPASGGVRIMGSATDVISVIPNSDVTALLRGFIVEMHPVNQNRVRLASDASVSWRGITLGDQWGNLDGTYNTTLPMAIATHGPARVYSGAAIAVNAFFCSDATGRARTWVAGVDAAGSLIGRTKTSATAIGDKLDVVIEGGG